MNPIRQAWDPERRGHYRKQILVTFWVVIFVNVVVSTGALIVARDGQGISRRGQKAICVEIKFLEGNATLAEKIGRKTKDPELRKERFEGAKGARHLAQDLRNLGIECR